MRERSRGTLHLAGLDGALIAGAWVSVGAVSGAVLYFGADEIVLQ